MREPGPPRLEVLGGAERSARAGRPRTVGLIPGSFDPLTVAHVALAEALLTDLTLFVYSAATLPKQAGARGEVTPPLLPAEDRVASLLAYCASRPQLRVALSSHGLYVDQVVAAASAFPGARLLLGMGSDKLAQLADPSWYDDRDAALNELFSRAELFFAQRRLSPGEPGAALGELTRWKGRLRRMTLPEAVMRVSSRAVRDALRTGGDVSALVPREVMPFLRPGEA